MATLHDLKEMGEKLGLTGSDLRVFIKEQQALAREERQIERQSEKDRREHELEKERVTAESRFKERELESQIEQEKLRLQAEMEREKCRLDLEQGKAEAREIELETEAKTRIEVEKEQSALKHKDLEAQLLFEKEHAELKRAQVEYELRLKREFEMEQAALREKERDYEREQAETRQRELKDKLDLLEREAELREKYKCDPTSGSGVVSAGSGYMKGPKLPFFDEARDDMDSYLQRFERVANAQRWKKEMWAPNLSALLRGRSLDVYSRLNPEEAQNYDVLKLALLKRFDITEEGFKRRFRTSKPDQGETCKQFVARLSNYMVRWVELAEAEKTYVGLFDLVMREQFLQTCAKDLAVFLKERQPESVELMAKFADQYLEARGPSNTVRPRTVDTRTQLRHMAEKTSKPYNFGQSRQPPVTQPYGNSTRKCYNCSGLGHVSRDCPSRKSTFGTTSSAKVGAFQGRGVYDRKERIDEDFRHRGTSRTRPWRGRGRGRDREEATLGQE